MKKYLTEHLCHHFNRFVIEFVFKKKLACFIWMAILEVISHLCGGSRIAQ